MVGAKQFAIHRKVATAPRINPLLAAISMPSFMKSHESELHKRGAFTDKPSAASFSLAKLIQVKPPVTRSVIPKATNQPREEKSGNELISDELANLITCKVLKNIKNYLNPQREMNMGMGRHIKLEISL